MPEFLVLTSWPRSATFTGVVQFREEMASSYFLEYAGGVNKRFCIMAREAPRSRPLIIYYVNALDRGF